MLSKAAVGHMAFYHGVMFVSCVCQISLGGHNLGIFNARK